MKQIEKDDSVWTGPKQIERLTKPGTKYLNLNPYEVSCNVSRLPGVVLLLESLEKSWNLKLFFKGA